MKIKVINKSKNFDIEINDFIWEEFIEDDKDKIKTIDATKENNCFYDARIELYHGDGKWKFCVDDKSILEKSFKKTTSLFQFVKKIIMKDSPEFKDDSWQIVKNNKYVALKLPANKITYIYSVKKWENSMSEFENGLKVIKI